MWAHIPWVIWRSAGSLFFINELLRMGRMVARFGGKCLYPPNHLTVLSIPESYFTANKSSSNLCKNMHYNLTYILYKWHS